MKTLLALVAAIVVFGCTNNASVEFGMNDETLFDGVAGDLRMRVLKIEVPDGNTYTSVWEGAEYVQVELETSDFATITNGYEDIEPRSYTRIRLTVDSLTHVQQTAEILLIDTALAFVAQAFTPLVISGGDELKLVVSIASEIWFDDTLPGIIQGHEPFEGAALRIYYE